MNYTEEEIMQGKPTITKIEKIIPAIMTEMQSDGDNESDLLFNYYTQECNQTEKTIVNNVLLFLCGWSFETICENVGLEVDPANGNITDPDPLG